ncbi:MAG: STAS domain-containing protein [Candidatus Eremiobacteraeota bacterium]|nr:STAS domain-containing protein [Candidatus Eremiobacteraeota bacterium]
MSSRTHGKRTVIVVSVYTSQRLRDEISDLVERARYLLVINLEHVRYMDSTGLGVLIGGLKRVREFDGTVKLVCTNQNIVKIFNITGLTRIFSIFEDEAAAIEAILKERNGHVRDD